MRTEKDFLGEVVLPDEALYGIHAYRARENFPNSDRFKFLWYKSMALVKLACFNTYQKFKDAAQDKYASSDLPIEFMDDALIEALAMAAQELSEGHYFDHFIVPAVQGGAGTSINMNVNEIICNVALKKMGRMPGDYQHADPFEHANVYQSTNDVVPTALKVAVMQELNTLENSINELRQSVEANESKYRHILRLGFTQMQAAVPTTFDRLFSTYNNALSRDWWRVSKCFERIKEVNLGGGAIGSGLSIPRFFIMQVVSELQQLTGLPVTRSENLSDATSNLDSYTEVHATLKAHAVNLEKMANDLRLLSSDIMKDRLMSLPQRQVGSSIMPGKVNPVIVEFVISSVHQVYANDMLISSLCGQGCLELNAYLPSIGHATLSSLELLTQANNSLKSFLMDELLIEENNALIYSSPSVTTALIPYIGYHAATRLAKLMKSENLTVFEANNQLQLISHEQLTTLMQPEQLIKQGYSLNDLAKGM